ncbi:hypothetical protein BCIN_05g06670 [Botrytis cinerea B05.10]|uniref:Uncharacterized protein n=2 Tax=Botryotinia fuckeliana TaxID=40559 RepID=A0A384JI84_BOTFB|nr:hypothetical protein BCIN_05g06670 [Botrytis cinerea B05.10]ATZ50299.1 hypothetical protein BCIN_05g06670 [Botrytis cinerea B05.10]CCD53396.1 hypothetical protein BofuT4_P134410.1 [Botrytis cinerea T4]
MEDRSNEPKYLDTEISPPSPPSNPKTVDSSRNTLSPISTHLNNENMFQTPFLTPRNPPPNTRSEPSNPAETTIISFADPSPTRHQKEPHPLKNRKNKSSDPFPNSLHHNQNHNPNSNPKYPAPNTTDPNSASQPPSEHSSGSDAAFYCSVGSSSSDGEDASSDSWVPATEIEMDIKSSLAKVSLREAGSAARTDGASASAVIEDEEDDDDNNGEEERNEIHDKDGMRRKSKKRFTFLKRIFGRKKSRDDDDDDGGVGGIG